jgi:hypothetical protein
MIETEINAFFSASDDENPDGVLSAFDQINANATKSDVPALLDAIRSPKNNFWTRELLSQPICKLGGIDCLELLLEALQKGKDEGHDNDGFVASLWTLTDADPRGCRTKLNELLSRADFKQREQALWLLEFCQTN